MEGLIRPLAAEDDAYDGMKREAVEPALKTDALSEVGRLLAVLRMLGRGAVTTECRAKPGLGPMLGRPKLDVDTGFRASPLEDAVGERECV